MIKKIMKQDGEVKINAKAPILFFKAAEIFISELSLHAWIHTEQRTINDVHFNATISPWPSQSISKHDQFDFLIDIALAMSYRSNGKMRRFGNSLT